MVDFGPLTESAVRHLTAFYTGKCMSVCEREGACTHDICMQSKEMRMKCCRVNSYKSSFSSVSYLIALSFSGLARALSFPRRLDEVTLEGKTVHYRYR